MSSYLPKFQSKPEAICTTPGMPAASGAGALQPSTPARVESHISVCVCTFKRPAMLAALLETLLKQKTQGRFTYSIVVVDNDCEESGRETAERFARANPGLLEYHVEPEQNIAQARNRAVSYATGELVAFIDDDETPIEGWLLRMHEALLNYRAAGVLGPVKPRFAVTPPSWVIKAQIFERPGFPTGTTMDWRLTGTGNVLVWRHVLELEEGPFRPQFGSGGEDLDFFRRAMVLGNVFVWCDEATVYEIVPRERTTISFQLRRALLRGRVTLSHPSGRALELLKSLIACCLYTILLPVFLIKGRHVFLKYLIRDFDHIGKLLAWCGISVVRQKYVVK